MLRKRHLALRELVAEDISAAAEPLGRDIIVTVPTLGWL
jgi:hypothetical protein